MLRRREFPAGKQKSFLFGADLHPMAVHIASDWCFLPALPPLTAGPQKFPNYLVDDARIYALPWKNSGVQARADFAAIPPQEIPC
ncbi:MAG: hypothetical protein PGN26_04155 [Xylophilus ampelinus]